MQVTDHVYLLSGAGYGQVGNVYAILNEEKLFLIDAGKDQPALDIIKESLVDHHLDRYPITHVLLTHMHLDHSGNAWYFREQGAKIMISEEDAHGVENGGVAVNDYGIFPFYPCKVDEFIRDGETMNINGVEITAMLVPGHTNGGMFFMFEIDGKTMCATGDTVLPLPGEFDRGFEASLGWMGSSELDGDLYIQGLTKALSIKCDILLCGHGVPVMKNGDHIIRMGLRLAIRMFRNKQP